MNKSIWKYLVIALMIPALLCTVSCSKKAASAGGPASTVTGDSSDEAARLAKEKAAREAALEAQRRAAEAAAMKAKESFQKDDVYFDFDSAALSAAAQGVLNQKSQYLLGNSGVQASIEGHCDERGTNAYNLALGDRRAQSAKSFLVKLGVSESRLSTVSYGEEKPVDAGHNEAAWSKNRRAHFVQK